MLPQNHEKELRKEEKKKPKYIDTPPPPLITCGKKAFKELVKQWIDTKVLTLKPPKITLAEEMKPKPDYFMLHQYLGRSTKDFYYNLKRKYHDKVASGKVEVKKNDILNKPLPKHEKKASCSTIIGFDEMMAKFQEIPP